jgi:hypothetical protein
VTAVKGLGPDPGLPVSHFLTNQGKTNQVGRVEYTGAAPHSDALRDVSASLGVLHLYRFLMTAENFPNFLDYNNFMDVPTLPSLQKPWKSVPDTTFSKNYTAFYADSRVYVNKLTHQLRGQAEREMDNNGVDPAHTSRMAGHASADVKQSRAQKKSYLFPPPVPGLAQRCGCDPRIPRSHYPPWITVVGEPLEALMHLSVEPLLVQQSEVHGKYYACRSYNERKAGRWCSAKGSIDSMLHDIRRAFQMLASRPICPDTGVLLADQPTFREQFKSGAFHELLTHRVFEGDEWKHFEQLMRTAQDEYFSTEITVSVPIRNEMERILKAHVDGRLTEIARGLHAVLIALGSSNPVNGGVSLGRHIDGPVVSPPSPGLPSLQPSLPAHEDTLADGVSQRKRRRAIPQQDIVREERERARAQGLKNLPEVPNDQACCTLEDYWQMYKVNWLPREIESGGDWRRDKQLLPGQRQGGKAQWWSQRAPMFALMNHYMKVSNLTEEKALFEANKTFCSVALSKKSKTRPIKALSVAFRAKLGELGVPPSVGRPKKKRRGNNGSAFAAAFESA